ncbi:hypothetical protein BROUX41_001484 [Berkeleyomyces rouxiae]|uniref:uncharacterized protein n=1 Tax=Berkeleyomyces rouxiae TaxID=2035830 RepID=UPI003B7B0631
MSVIPWSLVVKWAQAHEASSTLTPEQVTTTEHQVLSMLPAMIEEIEGNGTISPEDPDFVNYDWVSALHRFFPSGGIRATPMYEDIEKICHHGRKKGTLQKWLTTVTVEGVSLPNAQFGFLNDQAHYFTSKKTAKKYACFWAVYYSSTIIPHVATALQKEKVNEFLSANPQFAGSNLPIPIDSKPDETTAANPSGNQEAGTKQPCAQDTGSKSEKSQSSAGKHSRSPETTPGSSQTSTQSHSPPGPNKRQAKDVEGDEIKITRDRVREMCETLAIDMPQIVFDSKKSASSSKPSISAKLQFQQGQNFLFPRDFVVYDKYDKRAAEQNLWDNLLPTLQRLMESRNVVK